VTIFGEMVKVGVTDMEKDSSVSFDNARQVEFTGISKFEKPKALITLEKLVGQEPNVHFVISYALQGKNTRHVQGCFFLSSILPRNVLHILLTSKM
jgi:hypothetical protein